MLGTNKVVVVAGLTRHKLSLSCSWGVKVVNRLTHTLPMNVNCKVYFNNFFSSISLLNSLKEDRLRSVATI